jgi:hypothetical protein
VKLRLRNVEYEDLHRWVPSGVTKQVSKTSPRGLQRAEVLVAHDQIELGGQFQGELTTTVHPPAHRLYTTSNAGRGEIVETGEGEIDR